MGAKGSTKYPPGYDLRQLRADRGLTQREVAVLTGLTSPEVSYLERGLVNPRPETIVRLARGLGEQADTMQRILAASATAETVQEARRRKLADELEILEEADRIRARLAAAARDGAAGRDGDAA